MSYINHLSHSLPEMAAPYTSRLSKPDERHRAIESLARGWLRTDRSAAEKWLNQSDLPAERRQILLNSK